MHQAGGTRPALPVCRAGPAGIQAVHPGDPDGGEQRADDGRDLADASIASIASAKMTISGNNQQVSQGHSIRAGNHLVDGCPGQVENGE